MEYNNEYVIIFNNILNREISFANELAEALMEDDIISILLKFNLNRIFRYI